MRAAPRRHRRQRRVPVAPLVGLALTAVTVVFLVRQIASSGSAAIVPRDGPAAVPTLEGLLVDDSALEWTAFPLPSRSVPAAAATAPTVPATVGSLEPVPTPILVPRVGPYNPTVLVPDPELSARVLQRVAGRSGKFGIAIKDLDTGRGVLIDPDGEYEAASLFKLPVMYEVFKQRESGRIAFDESLVLSERHVAYDLGTLDRGVGSSIGLAEALERMITISDNSSAVLLTDRVGAYNINQDMRSLGLERTRVLADELRTSPADMLNFFEMLALGQAVSSGASSEMLHLLARQRVNDRIPRLLPPGTIVAHKTGNLPGVVNDVGIVYGADLTFIVVVLVDRTRDEGEATRITADVALAAYEHFQGTRAREPGLAGTTQFPPAEPTPTRRPRPPTAVPTSTPPPTATDPETPATATPTATVVVLVPQLTSTAALPENSPTKTEPTALPTVLPNRPVPMPAGFTPILPRLPTQTPTVSLPTSTPGP